MNASAEPARPPHRPPTEVLPVETERLRLRLFEPKDLDDLHAMQSDPELVRYVPYEPRTLDEVRGQLDRRVHPPAMDEDGHVLQLVAERRDDGAFVGELTLFLLSRENRQGELGFILRREQQGNGFAVEAARATLGLAFDWLGLHRVIGQCDPRNAASAGVLRRLGMRQEAHLRELEVFKGEWGDLLVFAMLEDEWRAGTAAG